MTTRRQALKALFAAPVAAKGAMDAAAQEVTSMGIGSVGYGGADSVSCEAHLPSKLEAAIRDAQNAMWQKSEAKSSALHSMPPHIAGKKSWSAAFKHSEAAKEIFEKQKLMRDVERLMYDESLTGKARRSLLKALGLGDLA